MVQNDILERKKNQTETSNECTQNVFIISNLKNVVNTLYALHFIFLRYVDIVDRLSDCLI